jgi:hypothetical protein
MCLQSAPEKYIAGAALDRAALELTPKRRAPGRDVIRLPASFGSRRSCRICMAKPVISYYVLTGPIVDETLGRTSCE